MPIYHIVLPEIWEKSKDERFYEADSLKTEGFIHCSFAEQLQTVLRRYYKDVERVLILQIEPELLASKIVEEPSTDGEIYPHVYGKINTDAIIKVEERNLKPQNRHR